MESHLDSIHLSISLLLASVCLIQPKFLEYSAGEQEASGIGSSVILEAAGPRQTIVRKLVCIGRLDNDIAGNGGIGQLRDREDIAIEFQTSYSCRVKKARLSSTRRRGRW